MSKPLVALFKTFRGGEWFELSLESIQQHCVGVVAVTSALPWKGLPGTENRDVANFSENCREPLARFQARHPNFPVTEVRLWGRPNSAEQYTIGLAAIKALHGSEVGVLVIDTDEVWEATDLEKLRRAMAEDTNSLYFRSGIWTYIRSPFYRVHPQEKARVVVGLASPEVAIGDSRFSGLARIVGRGRIADVACSYHHLGYVRFDPEEITVKLDNTSSQDAVANRPGWKQEVWDKLPSGKDIHPVVGYHSSWPGVTELPLPSLPYLLTHSEAFWASAGHHRGSIPEDALFSDDPAWRYRTERDEGGIRTTVPLCHVVPFCAAMMGKISQDNCLFLVPRLRMSFRETVQLAAHARQVPARGTILEIGSGMGGSVAVMGFHAQAGVRLRAVDPYIPYDEENVVLNKNVEVGTVADFEETVSHNLSSDISLLRMTSAEAISKFSDRSLDLVLVDGNHSYSHALYDLKAWWGKLKQGGTLLLHDVSGRFPGVVRAAREFEEVADVHFNLPCMSSLAWVRKPS